MYSPHARRAARIFLALFLCAAGSAAAPARAAEPRACATAGERSTCASDPYNCPCDAYGRCGLATCKVSRCSTAAERTACGHNPQDCPCDYFGNCEMTTCVAPTASASAAGETGVRYGGVTGAPVAAPPAQAAPPAPRTAPPPQPQTVPAPSPAPAATQAPPPAYAPPAPAASATSAPSTSAQGATRCPYCGQPFPYAPVATTTVTTQGATTTTTSVPSPPPSPDPTAAPSPSAPPAAREVVHPEALQTGRYCSTDSHRASCRQNPTFCPCGYYHDCGMANCRAPGGAATGR